MRYRTGKPRTGGIGTVRQLSACGAGRVGKQARERVDLTVVALSLREIAGEDQRAVSVFEDRGDLLMYGFGRKRRQRLLNFLGQFGGNVFRDSAERGRDLTRRDDDFVRDREVTVIVDGIDHDDFRARQRRFADAVVNERLLVAWMRAYEHDRVGRFELFKRHAERRVQRCGRVSGEIDLPRPVVDVVATEFTDHPLQQVELFSRRGRRRQCGDAFAVTVGGQLPDLLNDSVQGNIPVAVVPFAVAPDARRGQSLLAVQCFVAETIAVGKPCFVHRRVVLRHNPLYDRSFHVEVNV